MKNIKNIGSVIQGCEYFYILDMMKKNEKSILYVGRDDREIFDIKDKIKWFISDFDIFIYRSWDQIPYDNVSPSKEIQSERIKTLYNLKKLKNKTLVLTSINALIQKTLNKNFLSNYFINISIGENIEFDKLIQQLFSFGYQRTSVVRDKTEFAVRGSIIDIFVVDRNNPIRIDFLDNKIESIHEFDLVSQRRRQKISSKNVLINPSCEIFLNNNTVNNFKNTFRKIFSNYRNSEIYQSIKEGIFTPGLEQMLPLFHKSLNNLLDYCKKLQYNFE